MTNSNEKQPNVLPNEEHVETALIKTLPETQTILLSTPEGLDQAWEIALKLAKELSVDPRTITLEQLKPYLNQR